jgi:hypothetical protein
MPPDLGSTPNSAAISGTRAPTRFTVASRSSVTCSGFAVGTTSVRTGENATASSNADQRSAVAVGSSAARVAAARRLAASAGNGTPALGG